MCSRPYRSGNRDTHRFYQLHAALDALAAKHKQFFSTMSSIFSRLCKLESRLRFAAAAPTTADKIRPTIDAKKTTAFRPAPKRCKISKPPISVGSCDKYRGTPALDPDSGFIDARDRLVARSA